MEENKSSKVTLCVAIEGGLFEELEKARLTERGKIPRNEFIRHAVVEQIERTKEERQRYVE